MLISRPTPYRKPYWLSDTNISCSVNIKFVGFVCSKCQKYSPTEPSKAYDKTISRRTGVTFDPKQVLDQVRSEFIGERKALRNKDDYVKQYTEVR